MKKVIFIAICLVGFVGLTSCGSTSPCGLSKKTEKNQPIQQQQDILVADATLE